MRTFNAKNKYKDNAKQFCKVEVKNGRRTSFWYENWSTLGPLLDVVGERGMIDLGISRHMAVADAWSGRRQRRHRAALLNRIEEALMLQKRNRVDEEDKVLWRGVNDTYKDKFLTKETWRQTRSVSNKVPWYEGIWFAHATPKYSFCAWLAVQNRLSTKDRMLQWNRGLQATCTLCNNNFETRDHLFFSCSFAAEVWENLAKNIYKARFSTNWSALIATVSGHWQDRIESFIARYLLQVTVHTVWRERNGRTHGEPPNPGSRLIQWIDKQVRNQISTIKATGDRRYEKALQIWFQSRP